MRRYRPQPRRTGTAGPFLTALAGVQGCADLEAIRQRAGFLAGFRDPIGKVVGVDLAAEPDRSVLTVRCANGDLLTVRPEPDAAESERARIR